LAPFFLIKHGAWFFDRGKIFPWLSVAEQVGYTLKLNIEFLLKIFYTLHKKQKND